MAHSTATSPTAPAPLADFAAYVEVCQRPLVAFLRGIVADGETARDLTQDTFCAAWQLAQRAAPPFDAQPWSERDVRRWLFHVAYNRAVSALRRRRLLHWRSLDEPAAEDTVEFARAGFEDQLVEAHVMRAALRSLSPSDTACLLLIAVHDFTAAEVGQIVGASPPAVTKRFARAKRRLRDAYLAQTTRTEERSLP